MAQEPFQPWQYLNWLTSSLRASNTIHNNTEVIEATTTLLTGGLMADTLRLSLQYANATGGEPSSIVGKFPSSNPDSRVAGHEMAAYFKEINFYQHIAPKLHIRTPLCYHASIDEDTSDFALLLENISPALVADDTTKNAKDLLLLSLSELALLHGETQGREDIKVHAIRRRMSDQLMTVAANGGWKILKKAATDRLSGASIAAGDSLLANIDRLHRFKNLRPSLVHGDYRFANFLYRGNSDVITVDWQTYDWSNPGIDLVHVILCSLNPEQAEAWYVECVHHYHEKILEAGVDGYSLDDCYYDFKVGILFDMQMMMITTFGVGANNLSDIARDQILTACEKIWSFADNLNALDIL